VPSSNTMMPRVARSCGIRVLHRLLKRTCSRLLRAVLNRAFGIGWRAEAGGKRKKPSRYSQILLRISHVLLFRFGPAARFLSPCGRSS
jgi:hypothetical protein